MLALAADSQALIDEINILLGAPVSCRDAPRQIKTAVDTIAATGDRRARSTASTPRSC